MLSYFKEGVKVVDVLYRLNKCAHCEMEGFVVQSVEEQVSSSGES